MILFVALIVTFYPALGLLKGILASLSLPQGQASSTALPLCCGPLLRAAAAELAPGCGRA